MDVTLENPGSTGTEGAKRYTPLNLSGKRTEMCYFTGDRVLGCFCRSHAIWRGSFFPAVWMQEEICFMGILNFFTGPLNTFAWMYTFLPFAIAGGAYLTIRSGGVQFRHFGHAMKAP